MMNSFRLRSIRIIGHCDFASLRTMIFIYRCCLVVRLHWLIKGIREQREVKRNVVTEPSVAKRNRGSGLELDRKTYINETHT